MYLVVNRGCFKDAYGLYYRVKPIEYNAALSREVSPEQLKLYIPFNETHLHGKINPLYRNLRSIITEIKSHI